MNDEERREERRQLAETFRAAKPEVLSEIIRQAESFLAEQLKAGLAADQRAMNVSVILAAILASIVGGTAILIAVGTKLGSHLAGVGPLAVCLTVALVFAMKAARPTRFTYSGTNPTKWRPDISDGRPLHSSLAGQAAIYAQGIELNKECLEEGHGWLRAAMWVAVSGTVWFAFAEGFIIFLMAARGDILV